MAEQRRRNLAICGLYCAAGAAFVLERRTGSSSSSLVSSNHPTDFINADPREMGEMASDS